MKELTKVYLKETTNDRTRQEHFVFQNFKEGAPTNYRTRQEHFVFQNFKKGAPILLIISCTTCLPSGLQG